HRYGVDDRTRTGAPDGGTRQHGESKSGALRRKLRQLGRAQRYYRTLNTCSLERESHARIDLRRASARATTAHRCGALAMRLRLPGDLCRNAAYAVPGRSALPLQAESALQALGAACCTHRVLASVSPGNKTRALVPAAGRLLA